MKKLLPLVIALACSGASAVDLGVQGNVWTIVERDIRQMMVEDAAGVDWSGVQDQVKESAKTYLDRLPKRQLPRVESTYTAWVDPSIELTEDIQVPVEQADGSYAWQVLAAKGTRVNPLHTARPVIAMFFYDGADPEQLEFMKALAQREPNRIMMVETGSGSVKDASDAVSLPVYHANDAMLSRFQIRYLPSLLYPGTGEKSDYLGVTTYGAPYKVEEVLSTWEDFGFTSAAKNEQKGTQ